MRLLGVAILDKNDLPVLVRTYREDLNINDISNMLSVACSFLSQSSTGSGREAFVSTGATSIYYFKLGERGCLVVGEKADQESLSKVARVLVEIEFDKIEAPLEEVMYAIDRVVAAVFGEDDFVKQILDEEILQKYRVVFVNGDNVISLNFSIDENLLREIKKLIRKIKKNTSIQEKTLSSGEKVFIVYLGSNKTLCLIGSELNEKAKSKIERIVKIFRKDAPSVLLTGELKKMYDAVRASYSLLIDNGEDYMLYEIYTMLSRGESLRKIIEKMYREHYAGTL